MIQAGLGVIEAGIRVIQACQATKLWAPQIWLHIIEIVMFTDPSEITLMCNLYSILISTDEMQQAFDVDAANAHLGNAEPLSALFPRYSAPIVRLKESGARELLATHWGFLMPQVSKKTGKPIMPKAINNARDDKVLTSPFWQSSFEQRRCLVPASSFCEARGRMPATYYWFGIEGECERPLFAFAGLWRRFKGMYRGELVEIDTHTVITTTPNELVREIHPTRMPVILDPGDYETWLTGNQDDARELMRPFDAEKMLIVQSGEGLKADQPFSKNPG